jgi:hypothetical protein
MAISYTWNISSVDTYPTEGDHSDVIYNVHWRLTAEDDANQDSEGDNLTSSTYSNQSLDTSDISDFTNFDDVTSSQVQGWVEAALGADMVQEIKDGLDAQIAELVTPTSVTRTLVG